MKIYGRTLLKKIYMLLALVVVMSAVLGSQMIARAEASVTMIYTAEDLVNVSNNLSGNYRLANDIDLTSYLADKSNGWASIGPFSGKFDGDSHKITGLWHNSGGAYKGLFSTANNATIQNLIVELDAKGISGAYEVGGIVGKATGATVIENCTVSGGPIKVTGGGYAGGIVGKSDGPDGKVINCTVMNVTTYTSGNYSGGIIGVAYKTKITGCKTVDVRAEGNSYVGGLAGAIHGQSVITDSSAAGGSIYARSSYAGGFIGAMYEQSTISRCNAEFETVRAAASYAGGFIGTAYEKADISYCYATADVFADYGNYVGGFAGELNSVTVTNACSTGNVAAVRGQVAGGFAGIAYAQSSLTRCNALGDVSSNGNYAGGLLGQLHAGSINNASTVEQCSAYGNVTAKGNVVGGLIGESLYSKVSNSYARGDVSGKLSVGGLVGYFSGTASSGQTVLNSYSTGTVSGISGSELGAFTGHSGVTFTGTNYYDSDRANVSASHGSAGSPSGIPPQGRGTEEMMKQETFVGWDFGNIWNIVEGETYPYFDFCGFTPEVQNVSRRPVINIVYTTDKRVSGTGIPGSEVTVTFPSGAINVTEVDSQGKWYIAVPSGESLYVGDTLTGTQKEAGKLVSGPANTVVAVRNLLPSIEKNWENLNGKSTVRPGDTLLFTITIENTDASTLTWKDVVAIDALHQYVSFTDGTLEIDGTPADIGQGEEQYMYDEDSHSVTIYLGLLVPGQSKTITFQVVVNEEVPDQSEINSGVHVTGNY
ncbi:GLUG motif-containing protein [Lacrimispora indolis]|uniref:GLUG motif-containing protein n=1 Tax=Lacrimispora indolis TaxID=69825 RepID=UPI0014096DAA|nr:GLUG motif-containing protein [Lacrimispora indolis]